MLCCSGYQIDLDNLQDIIDFKKDEKFYKDIWKEGTIEKFLFTVDKFLSTNDVQQVFYGLVLLNHWLDKEDVFLLKTIRKISKTQNIKKYYLDYYTNEKNLFFYNKVNFLILIKYYWNFINLNEKEEIKQFYIKRLTETNKKLELTKKSKKSYKSFLPFFFNNLLEKFLTNYQTYIELVIKKLRTDKDFNYEVFEIACKTLRLYTNTDLEWVFEKTAIKDLENFLKQNIQIIDFSERNCIEDKISELCNKFRFEIQVNFPLEEIDYLRALYQIKLFFNFNNIFSEENVIFTYYNSCTKIFSEIQKKENKKLVRLLWFGTKSYLVFKMFFDNFINKRAQAIPSGIITQENINSLVVLLNNSDLPKNLPDESLLAKIALIINNINIDLIKSYYIFGTNKTNSFCSYSLKNFLEENTRKKYVMIDDKYIENNVKQEVKRNSIISIISESKINAEKPEEVFNCIFPKKENTVENSKKNILRRLQLSSKKIILEIENNKCIKTTEEINFFRKNKRKTSLKQRTSAISRPFQRKNGKKATIILEMEGLTKELGTELRTRIERIIETIPDLKELDKKADKIRNSSHKYNKKSENLRDLWKKKYIVKVLYFLASVATLNFLVKNTDWNEWKNQVFL